MKNIDYLDISEKRGYLVVKANFLIQKAVFSLPALEQKLLAHAISKIKPEDSNFLEQKINITEIINICGLSDSGRNYEMIKEAYKSLSDRSWWYTSDGEEKENLRIIDKIKTDIKINSGNIKLIFHQDMKPFLIQLKNNFTNYELNNVLKMKSQYSIRIYELLKSHQFRKKIRFEISELKKILNVDKIKSYERFPDFRRKVIEVAIEEINELTDLKIEYELEKNGRAYGYIIFRIKERNWLESIKAKDNAFGDAIEGQIDLFDN